MAVTALNSGDWSKMADNEEVIARDEKPTEEVDISPEVEDESGDPFEDLENDETSWDDYEDDSDDSESEEPDKVEESEESEDEPEETTKEEQPEEESKEEPEESSEEESEEDTTSDKPKKGEPDPDMAREAFKRREAERKLREERQARERQDLERYLQEAEGDEVELVKRQAEVQRHLINQERAQLNQEKLDVQMTRAVSELNLKNVDSRTKEYVARALDKFEAINVVRDDNGNIMDVKGDVYQYLKEEMDFIKDFQGVGAREQTKKKAAEKTRTVQKPTRTPKEPEKDPDIDAFDKEFYGEE